MVRAGAGAGALRCLRARLGARAARLCCWGRGAADLRLGSPRQETSSTTPTPRSTKPRCPQAGGAGSPTLSGSSPAPASGRPRPHEDPPAGAESRAPPGPRSCRGLGALDRSVRSSAPRPRCGLERPPARRPGGAPRPPEGHRGPGTRRHGRDTVLSLAGQVCSRPRPRQHPGPGKARGGGGGGGVPRAQAPKVWRVTMPDLWCVRKLRCEREAEERRPRRPQRREGMCALPNGDGWPRKPAPPSEAAEWKDPALTFLQPLVTSHPPLSQDAAGPPGPLCAGPAARLRLAGAPVRQHPRRAQSPEPSGSVVAPTRSPEARSAKPCP